MGKKSKAFEKYRKKKLRSTKPSSRNSYTEQKIINSWLLRDRDKKKDKDKKRKKDKDKDEKRGNAFDRNRSRSSGGGGKGDSGKGGGSLTKGPSNEKGLDFYKGTDGASPFALEKAKEIELRGIDSENANKLQSIINKGKLEVAVIQRDASIYGSLVSGFW